jgi:hypothetical protein
LVPTADHVRFVEDSVAVGEGVLRVLRFFPVYIIPTMVHTYFVYTLLIPEIKTDVAWGHSKSNALPEISEH